MPKEDKKGQTRSNTLRAILHFLSGKPGAGNHGRVILDKRILFAIVLGIALAADLLTKWAAFHFLRLDEKVSVIPGFFDLRPVWNAGIVFGLPAPMWLTSIVSIVATIVVAWYLKTARGKAPVVQLYLGLILSGVLGNLFDRIVFVFPPYRPVGSFWDYFKTGAVRDFIEIYVGKYHWPNFNLADAFILIGVALAMIQFILTDEGKKTKTTEAASKDAAGNSSKDADK